MTVLSLPASLLALASCQGIELLSEPFDQPVTLGGQSVSAETLNLGRDSYVRHCQACHGMEGDGHGPSSFGLRPPPRDFRVATYKFSWTVDGLPHDDDLERIILSGMHGTAMLDWDVPRGELEAVVQYLKTFSPEGEGWRDPSEALGTQIKPGPDPYGDANEEEAVARGAKLYHGYAQCLSCHPAYLTKADVWAAAAEFNKPADFRQNMYLPEAKDSDYMVGEVAMRILPPDFTWDEVRSIRPATSKADLFSLIGSGIGGTAMPAWKGSLPGPDGVMGNEDDDHDLWALAYYIDSLIALRDTPAAADLRKRMETQPEFVPPVAATAEGEVPAAEGAPATPG